MTAAEVWLSGQAALPPGGNASAAAHGDKEQGKHTAVAGVAARRRIRDALENEVGRHEGILHVQRDEVVEDARLFQRIGHPLGQRLHKGTNKRGEDDVRRLLLRIEIRLYGVCLHRGNIVVARRVDIGVLHIELVVFLHVLLPADRALRRILGCKLAGLGIHLLDADLALLLTLGGDGQVNAHEHTRREPIIVYADARTDADAIGDTAVLAHQTANTVKTALALLLRHALHTVHLYARADGKGWICFAQRLKEAVQEVHLAVDIEPADFAGVHALVEFLLGKIGDVPAHHSKCGGTVERVILRDPADDLALSGQARAHWLRQVILRKTKIDETDCAFKIAPCLAPGDIVRQANVQILQGIVNIHEK